MRFIALLLICSVVNAGPWNPPQFIPVTHADGSQTWQIKILLSDLSKADRLAPDRDNTIASRFLAHHKFCTSGWELTESSIEKKWLVLGGKCITR